MFERNTSCIKSSLDERIYCPPHPIVPLTSLSLLACLFLVFIFQVPQRAADLSSSDCTSERDTLFLPVLTGHWAEGDKQSSPLTLPSKTHTTC